MRLLVFFDLPVKEKKDRKAYAAFHRFLLTDGYDMIQYSVYARICNGQDMVDRHLRRLADNKPERGSVRYLQVTEKQFTSLGVVVGTKKEKEQERYAEQLTFF